jgi:hypothetical protein
VLEPRYQYSFGRRLVWDEWMDGGLVCYFRRKAGMKLRDGLSLRYPRILISSYMALFPLFIIFGNRVAIVSLYVWCLDGKSRVSPSIPIVEAVLQRLGV